MPGTIINDDEIITQGNGTIKAGGNLYIEKGRKYIGKKVRYFIMNDKEVIE